MSDVNMNIVIGATVQDALRGLESLSAELRDLATGGTASIEKINAAMKTLRDVQSKATDPAQLVQYNRAIAALATEAAKLKQVGFDDTLIKQAHASNTATLALTNLGRVAQDLPYGFVGIANNLNPLFEGFQRLNAEAKTTGTSVFPLLLKSLTGAGGIGLAISAVTAAISFASIGLSAWTRGLKDNKEVVDDAGKAFEALNGFIKSTKRELGEGISVVDEAITAYSDLARNVDELRKKYEELADTPLGIRPALHTEKALEDLNKAESELSKNKTAIAEAELLEQQKLNVRLNAVQSEKAVHDIQLQKSANEAILADTKKSFADRFAALKKISEEEQAINRVQFDKELQTTNGDLAKVKQAEENFRFDNLKAQQDYFNKLNSLQESQADAASKAADKAGRAAKKAAEEERKRLLDFQKAMNDLRSFLFKPEAPIAKPFELKLLPSIIPLSETEAQATLIRMRDALQKAGVRVFSSQGILSKVDLLNDKEVLANFTALTDKLAAATFLVRDAFDSIFQSIESGKNVFDAIGQSLTSLLKKLVATAIEAAILTTILSLISGGGFAAVTIKGIINDFKGLLGIPGFAGGGIVTRPTLAMVAEQGPERITPLNQISNNGGGSFPSEIILRAAGSELRTVLKRDGNNNYFIN